MILLHILMGSPVDAAERQMKRRERMRRRAKLLRILQAILSGKIDSKKGPVDSIFNVQYSPRMEYQSPRERDRYDHRNMEVGEMLAGTPNVWR